MPIVVQCATCQGKFKAPDHLAGKKVKCPKCSKVIVVSGTTSPPAVAPQAAPKVRLPLRSFEELKVPRRLRKTVEEEVGNEQLVWLGRPTPRSLYAKAMIGMWVGLVLCILMIGGAIIGLGNINDDTMKLIVAGSIGVAFLTMGLPLATMPIWVRWLINFRDCYALTPTRAIVFDNEKILSAVSKPYTADDLHERHLSVNADDTGSIIFEHEAVALGDITIRRTRDKKGPGGEKVRETTTKTRRQKGMKGVGFVDIEDVEKVEAMLRQVLKLGPPASKDVD